jgi:hypothetical protein
MGGFIFRICWTLSSLRIIRTAGELLLLDMLSHSEVITGLPNQNQPGSKSYLFSPQAGWESDMCICTFFHEDVLLHWLFSICQGTMILLLCKVDSYIVQKQESWQPGGWKYLDFLVLLIYINDFQCSLLKEKESSMICRYHHWCWSLPHMFLLKVTECLCEGLFILWIF